MQQDFKQYRKKQLAEMRPYVEGEDVSQVSISPEDSAKGSPKVGDMIARNPTNHLDLWLVSATFVAENYVPV